MPFHSYRRPPTSDSSPRAARPRFTSRYRPAPELPAPVLMLGAVSFRDRDGIWWTVREERALGRTGCLLFAAPGQLVRIELFPTDWRSLSTAGLLALSTTA